VRLHAQEALSEEDAAAQAREIFWETTGMDQPKNPSLRDFLARGTACVSAILRTRNFS